MDSSAAIIRQAQKELQEESFREAVVKEKERIRRHKPWWKRLLSIRIKIVTTRSDHV